MINRMGDLNYLIGVFLDYENYAPGRRWNLYSLSYDNMILNKFATARGIKIPSLAPDARKDWLEQQNLHEAFSEFQIAEWRRRKALERTQERRADLLEKHDENRENNT